MATPIEIPGEVSYFDILADLVIAAEASSVDSTINLWSTTVYGVC